MSRKPLDLLGKEFEYLEVIGKGSKIKGHQYWLCQCVCGARKEIRGSHLTSGGTVSCGCKRNEFEDVQDKQFDRLLVISYVEKRGKEHFWKCLCKCGKETIVGGNWLRSGNTRSCGCLQQERTSEACRKHGLASGEFKWVYNPAYYQYKRKNPLFLLKKNVSCMVYHALKRNDGSKHGESVVKYLPYSIDQLREHLERQFEPWMSWDNYGEWHIDHIMPHSSFNYQNMTDPEFLKCWALSNLRPLKAEANMRKWCKLPSV